MKRAAAAVMAAVLLVMLPACGGGGGSDSAEDDIEDDGGSTDTSPRTDQAVAEEAVLRLSDFPTEWRSTAVPGGTAAANVESNRALADCMGRPRPEEIRTALADSEDFSAQDTRRVSSSVQVVRTVEIAEDDFTALKSDKALECHKAQIDAEFARQLPPEASPQTTLERLTMPQFGDDTVAYRVAATTLDRGAQVRTFIDLVFFRKGRTEVSVNFLNVGVPFPGDLERTVLQRIVARL